MKEIIINQIENEGFTIDIQKRNESTMTTTWSVDLSYGSDQVLLRIHKREADGLVELEGCTIDSAIYRREEPEYGIDISFSEVELKEKDIDNILINLINSID